MRFMSLSSIPRSETFLLWPADSIFAPMFASLRQNAKDVPAKEMPAARDALIEGAASNVP